MFGDSLATMKPSLSTSYVVPAVLLNPVLFLHSWNALLARILPPIAVDAAAQHSPYTTFGPSCRPHLDIHANESLCWSYTLLMVCAQLVAFGRVSLKREEMKERARRKREMTVVTRKQSMKEVPIEKPRILDDRGGICLKEPAPTMSTNGIIKGNPNKVTWQDAGASQSDSSESSENNHPLRLRGASWGLL